MEFWSLLMVASMPISQILLVGLLGAFLASGYINILSSDAIRHMNKLVYVVFAPALMFANLAKTVTLKDILTWWFMPVNIGITFLIGEIFGRMTVKILKLEDHLQGVVIATCSDGNLGSLLLILIPAICSQEGNPFEDPANCNAHGLSYVTFSMALGGIFIWTIAYSQMKRSAVLYEISHRLGNAQGGRGCIVQETMHLTTSEPCASSADCQTVVPLLDGTREFNDRKSHLWVKLRENFLRVFEELLSPPTIAAIIGLFVGSIPWLKSSLIGSAAPLRLVQDSVTLLGQGWNTTLCNSHSRRKLDTRPRQVADKAPGDLSHHQRPIRGAAALRDRDREGRRRVRVPAAVPSVSLRAADTIHAPPSHGNRHHGPVVRCGAGGAVCHLHVDVLNCSIGAHCLVHGLHVDPLLNASDSIPPPPPHPPTPRLHAFLLALHVLKGPPCMHALVDA